MTAAAPERAVLTAEQREFFDANGYLVVEDALPPEIVAELDRAVDDLYDRARDAEQPEKNGKQAIKTSNSPAVLSPLPSCA